WAARTTVPSPGPSCRGILLLVAAGGAINLCFPRNLRHPHFGSRHRRRLLSRLPDRACRPSGEQATLWTCASCPAKLCRTSPLSTSHSRTVWSQLHESMRLPSGAKATEVTTSVCPVNTECLFPPLTSHSRIVLSRPHDRARRPSRENATHCTPSVCPS